MWLYCVVGFKADSLTRDLGLVVLSVVIFLRDPSSYLDEFRRKPRKISEQLGRQAWPGFETGTSRLPVLWADPLSHFWGVSLMETRICKVIQKHEYIIKLKLFFIFILFNFCLNFWDSIIVLLGFNLLQYWQIYFSLL